MKRSFLKFGVLFAAVLLLTGCFGRERVMVPPKVDLGGAESVAVIYFENYTEYPGAAYDIEERIGDELREYYYVVDRGRVESALAELGLRRGLVPTRDEICRLGRMLDVDVIVTGEVVSYFEEIVQDPPYIAKLSEDRTQAEWEVKQRTQVVLNFAGRVLDARSGNIMYSRRVQGEGSETKVTRLSWTKPDEAPSWILIPNPSRTDLPTVRTRAVTQAVDQFTADLLPTYVWRKIQE